MTRLRVDGDRLAEEGVVEGAAGVVEEAWRPCRTGFAGGGIYGLAAQADDAASRPARRKM